MCRLIYKIVLPLCYCLSGSMSIFLFMIITSGTYLVLMTVPFVMMFAGGVMVYDKILVRYVESYEDTRKG